MTAVPSAAWDDAATQSRFRAARRVGRVWLAVALVCFVGFLVYVTRMSNHTDWLKEHGVRTTGLVLEDPPQALRCGQVPIAIAVDVAGKQQVHTYFVDGCGGDGLSRGKRVTVWYNPTNVQDFIVNGKANEQPASTLLAVVALVASVFFGGGWAIRARRLHQTRRMLMRGEWVEVPAQVVPMKSSWTRGRYAVALHEGEPTRVMVTQSSLRDALRTAANAGPLFSVGTGDSPRVLSDRARSTLAFAQAPRSSSAQRRAHEALAGLQ